MLTIDLPFTDGSQAITGSPFYPLPEVRHAEISLIYRWETVVLRCHSYSLCRDVVHLLMDSRRAEEISFMSLMPRCCSPIGTCCAEEISFISTDVHLDEKFVYPQVPIEGHHHAQEPTSSNREGLCLVENLFMCY